MWHWQHIVFTNWHCSVFIICFYLLCMNVFLDGMNKVQFEVNLTKMNWKRLLTASVIKMNWTRWRCLVVLSLQQQMNKLSQVNHIEILLIKGIYKHLCYKIWTRVTWNVNRTLQERYKKQKVKTAWTTWTLRPNTGPMLAQHCRTHWPKNREIFQHLELSAERRSGFKKIA